MNLISLFSGAGGLDIGFKNAGFNLLWANDFDKDACETYKQNIGDHIVHGDIQSYETKLCSTFSEIDLVIGGPPCQGFSVAGKMDPTDPRSRHVWTFVENIERIKPKAFVMENVGALGKLDKWKDIRTGILFKLRSLGYATNFVIINAKDYGVPQSRERIFFIGFKTASNNLNLNLDLMLDPYQQKSLTLKTTLLKLDKAGTGNNTGQCNAKITLAKNPIMRKSPFAGMLFNGLGRPLDINGYSSTISASMGGNKTPIVDEEELYFDKDNWIIEYHKKLSNGIARPELVDIPKSVRRITVEEAALIQTFPIGYKFSGSQSSKFKQIGNAVPCNLSQQVAKMVFDRLLQKDFYKYAN